MPKTRSSQRQLEFAETTVLRWDELPLALRERVRDHLVVLLQEAARRAGAAREAGDDQ